MINACNILNELFGEYVCAERYEQYNKLLKDINGKMY